MQVLDGGEVHGVSTEIKNADEWMKSYETLKNIEAQEGLEKQLVVRHFEAHVTGEKDIGKWEHT